ncbi:hypothetical protein OKW21_006453 [Catalinimonas alkaloidigena]|nr:hypothetical protein [Catalinimonas alkaloidigena]
MQFELCFVDSFELMNQHYLSMHAINHTKVPLLTGTFNIFQAGYPLLLKAHNLFSKFG